MPETITDVNAFGLAAEGETRRKGEAAKHVGEDFIVSPKIAKHGIGDGIAAPIAAVMVAAHGEKDEFLGILDGQEAKENLIEKGEDGGICADAQGESQNGNDGETGSAREGAESEYLKSRNAV